MSGLINIKSGTKKHPTIVQTPPLTQFLIPKNKFDYVGQDIYLIQIFYQETKNIFLGLFGLLLTTLYSFKLSAQFIEYNLKNLIFHIIGLLVGLTLFKLSEIASRAFKLLKEKALPKEISIQFLIQDLSRIAGALDSAKIILPWTAIILIFAFNGSTFYIVQTVITLLIMLVYIVKKADLYKDTVFDLLEKTYSKRGLLESTYFKEIKKESKYKWETRN